MDITGEVDKPRVFCLNQSKSAPHENLFIGDPRLVCRSDADSQLLLFIPFRQTVKLSGMVLEGPAADHPTLAKVFVNQPALGFEEVDDVEAAQVLNLNEADCSDGAKEQKLKLVRFNKVNSLHIFLDRPGADSCAVSSLKFFGATVQATASLSELGKKKEEG